MARRAALAILLILAAACSQTTPGASHPSRPHVFLIVMENHSAQEALGGPFTASLAARYGVASNYHAVAHPSVPNYLALTSGSTWGIQDDSYRALPRQDIGSRLTQAGVSWRAYMEGLTDAGCMDSPVPYDPGHNPFAFYGGACPSNVVPLTALGGDLSASPPAFTWITPDRCHDTHDCDVATGDAWLRTQVDQITATRAWKSNGVLFVTWDEAEEDSSNRVLTLVVTPRGGHVASSREYTHYSLLATIEDLLGVGRLGESAGASPMTDLLPSTLSM